MEKLDRTKSYIIRRKTTSSGVRNPIKVSVMNVYPNCYEFTNGEVVIIKEFEEEFEIIDKCN